jgi:hypothetical protein
MANDGEYIDYTVFLGLNAAKESVRRGCKALVASRLSSTLFMTWDHVGRCDDVIWGYSRALQDRYYPFMDSLASHPFLRREGHEESTLLLAASDRRLQGLPVLYRLLLARALELDSIVFTVEPSLVDRTDLPVRSPPPSDVEVPFPDWLEPVYQGSLELRLPHPPAETS